MDALIIEPSKNTPGINFSLDGHMIIKGRSLPGNSNEFYTPIIDWASSITIEAIKLDIFLEYINSSSAKKILEFLKVLDANCNIKEFNVNWYYEEDDEDSLESGQLLEELLGRARFLFFKFSETA